MTDVLIAVNIEKADLESLSAAGLQPTSVSSRALDGNTIVQAFLAISITSVPVLRQWLIGRTERHKSTTVTIDGKKFVGHSADDVIKIIQAIEHQPLSPPDEPT